MGASAPNIAFLDAEGRSRNLEEWRGRFILLTFFSRTCKVCAREVPKLQEFAAKRAPDGVVLPVESTSASAGEVAAFASTYNVSMPLFHDPTWKAPEAYLVKRVPQVYIIAPDFTVLEDVVGEASLDFYNIRFKRFFP
ncbi:MAG: TlpA disulfide reductase family protein [Candidatus Sericytochromatia bacterium]|nr:TlpA disulfide reductase family protein [Candidatus Sericytochromatia bacterium]